MAMGPFPKALATTPRSARGGDDSKESRSFRGGDYLHHPVSCRVVSRDGCRGVLLKGGGGASKQITTQGQASGVLASRDAPRPLSTANHAYIVKSRHFSRRRHGNIPCARSEEGKEVRDAHLCLRQVVRSCPPRYQGLCRRGAAKPTCPPPMTTSARTPPGILPSGRRHLPAHVQGQVGMGGQART